MKRDFNWIIEIIERQRNGFIGVTARMILFTVSLVYRFAIACRNWAYERKVFRHYRVGVPVISVGNLTVGGTGKTPIVIWLAKLLNQSRRVAVVSRGYGSNDHRLNDEGQEIAKQLPGIVQVQQRDRVVAAQNAIDQLETNGIRPPLVILDDGFQHRRLGRDLDILVIDATCPYGLGHMLPRGYLREPMTSVARASVAILTRANLVPATRRREIHSKYTAINSKLIWAETALACHGWQGLDGKTHSIETLRDRKLLAFCGIGNPSSFFQTLHAERLQLTETIVFSDHHRFNETDFKNILGTATRNGCQAIVCTQKDLVKIDGEWQTEIPLFALSTETRFLAGQQEVTNAITNLLTKLKDAR